MNLFEIDAAIQKCFVFEDMVVDSETGEVLDSNYLNDLEMERDRKIENIAKWIKNLDSDIEQLKAQKDLFAKRQKSAENKRDSLKNYLSAYLNGASWKANDNSVLVNFRRSEVVSVDESIVPKKWFIKHTDIKLDKASIKEALKNGDKIKGAELVSKQNIQIK